MGLTHPHIDISFSIYFPSLFFHANISILVSYSELTFKRREQKGTREGTFSDEQEKFADTSFQQYSLNNKDVTADKIQNQRL